MNHHNHRESRIENPESSIQYRASSIEHPVIYVPIRHPSTNVEDSLQIDLFIQNKPNVKYAQITVSSFITSKYVKVDIW
jgi:hypothetical protein